MSRKFFRRPRRTAAPVSLIVLCSLLLATAATAIAADGALRVESSDRLGLRLAWDGVGEAQWRETKSSVSDVSLFEPQLEGFVNVGGARKPMLPRRTVWIILPPGTRPVLERVTENWRPTPAHRVLVGGTPVRLEDPQSGEVFIGEELLLPGEQLSRGREVEVAEGSAPKAQTEAVALGEVAQWRGRSVVALTLCPLRCDDAGVATSLLHGGTWRLRFEEAGQARAKGSRSRKRTTHGDKHLISYFLNGEQALGWTTDAAQDFPTGEGAPKRAAGKLEDGTPLMTGEIRIPITRTRFYRIEASELVDDGLLPAAGILESDLRLYQRRWDETTGPFKVEVPIRVIGDGGDFSGSDFIVFYGLRLRDDTAFTGPQGDIPACADPGEFWNDANIYWLAASRPAGGEAWVRMEEASLPAAQGTPEPFFRRTEHFEEAHGFRPHPVSAAEDRNMYNSRLDATIEVPTLPVYTPWGDSPTDGRITLTTYGYAYVSSRPVDVYLDTGATEPRTEHLLGSYNANRATELVLNYDLDPAWLADQPVSLRLVQGFGYFFLDSVDLAYDALYEAVTGTYFFANGAQFHCGEEAGERNIEVGGFGTGDIGLFDLTEPHLPVWIDVAAANVRDDTLSISVQQVAPVTRPRAFAAMADPTGTGIYPISYSRLEVVEVGPDPRALGGPADLLVITHNDFEVTLGRWIEHRQRRAPGGLEVRMVDVQDIYDWFGGGLKSAEIVKRMVGYAHDEWGIWALQLVGDANENVRDLGDLNESGNWDNRGADWVPTYIYIGGIVVDSHELLGTDDWYGVTGSLTSSPSSLYIGRFPCHTTAELDAAIDKVIAMETLTAGQTWRRRGVFSADDRWSSGYRVSDDPTVLGYSSGEAAFQSYEEMAAAYWRTTGLESHEFYLRDYLCPHFNNCPSGSDTSATRKAYEAKTFVATDVTPDYLGLLDAGAALVRYQGHGNAGVFAHENLILDQPNARRDVGVLGNGDRPFFFAGYGCHLSDWVRTPNDLPSAVLEPSLGEKLLLEAGGGACATYGSCGYETIPVNAIMSRTLARRWCVDPPRGTIAGGQVRSRWMAGELVWTTEADYAGTSGGVVVNYNLLGDALMIIDAGPAQVDAHLADAADASLDDGDEVGALDATNLRQLRLDASDEAGLAGVRVVDSLGEELTGIAVETFPGDETDHQQATYEITLPIRPFDHEIILHVYDTAWAEATDHHYTLTLELPQTLTVYHGGQAVTEGEFEFANTLPRDFVMQVETSAWLAPDVVSAVVLTASGNIDVTLGTIDRIDDTHLEVHFSAASTGDGECAVDLAVSGSPPTRFVLTESGSVPEFRPMVGSPDAFPNPFSDGTRFVFSTNLAQAVGRVIVYSSAGRPIASVPVAAAVAVDGGVVVPWDGRDDQGDELANGVYLYRVELEGARSEMQRLVVMR